MCHLSCAALGLHLELGVHCSYYLVVPAPAVWHRCSCLLIGFAVVLFSKIYLLTHAVINHSIIFVLSQSVSFLVFHSGL